MKPALAHLAANDPVLADLISHYPSPKFEKHTNYYQELVESIISQQLSVKAAKAIETRFKGLFGGGFPTPEQIIAIDIEEYRSVGLSRPKARYIQDLAQKVIDKEVTFSTLDTLSNDEIVAELTRVKGIGTWTVHMFLMFCMARLDVLPTGDLGIKNGTAKLYAIEHIPSEHEVEMIAQKNNWHPYESIASWYIWQSLNNSPK